MNLPNAISFGRFLTVPVIVWLIIADQFVAAFLLFSVAALSDAVDGYIAKRFSMATVLGGYVDPIADKTLLVGVFVTLGAVGAIPVWLAILVVFRDLSIVGGWLLLLVLAGPRQVRPKMVSKINTTVQLLLVIVVLADRAFAGMLPIEIPEILVACVAITTLVSGFTYCYWLIQALGDLERLP